MAIIYQKFIKRSDLRDNPNRWYVFGDNITRTGYGGQAAEMRGEPNALGIPTKYSPAKFLDDDRDFLFLAGSYVDSFKALNLILDHQDLVWPYDGIGTGLARMKAVAPRCWELLQCFINNLEQHPNA